MLRDVWIGLVLFAFSILYWLEADTIRISPLDGPVNASGMPKMLAYALGGLALVLVVRSLSLHLMARSIARTAGPAVPTQSDDVREDNGHGPMWRHMRAIGMIAIGIGYLLVVPYLGYALSIMGLVTGVALYNGARLDMKTAAVAVGGGIFFYLLFVLFLDIPLPPGVWPSLIGR